MPFAQLMAVLPLRDVACSLRVPSNPNGLKYNKDENETVIAHRSDCGLFLFRQKKGVRQWMSNSKLIELSYYDPSAQVRLSAYADILKSGLGPSLIRDASSAGSRGRTDSRK